MKVGAGAVLAGPISIGDDVVIGPNAVVMTNVPAGSIVTAPPSRIMTAVAVRPARRSRPTDPRCPPRQLPPPAAAGAPP